MPRVTLSLITLSLLSAFSTPSFAKIFPDQLVVDTGGDDVCRSGYRPITRSEATLHRDYLLSKMGQWQITGLKDNWVIMGTGHEGRIKQDIPNYSTWCHPNSTGNTEIPTLAKYTLPEGEEFDVEYSLVSDESRFIRPLSYLADYLGYAWVGGNSSDYVGRDMSVRKDGDEWVIQGNNRGSCTGYRCDEKTAIRVSNFNYTLNSDDFWHGEVTESDKQLITSIETTARNRSDIPQQMVVELKVDQSTNWSKTDTYGFSQAVETKNEFEWPLVGKTEVAIKLGANQSWANTNGGASSETVTLQTRPMVPANSEIPIRVELYRSTISYPYRFSADVSYDVEFDGFLRWGGNAWNTHPTNRPNHKHTFTMGRASNPSADIRHQWNIRHIPGASQWWDWSWAIQEYGLQTMQNLTSESLRPFEAVVSGHFNAESQFAGTVEIGRARPISDSHRSSANNILRKGDVELETNLDTDELRSLGFGDVELSVK
ncbi:aerolysin family beta-barrel pore-forming toxin [Grimontia sp. NTOU-MAR1]|uniref:aerolysin family beta-barrel pore-forming toxin n=1 Tax=Grimontia sp. NTOU-MAR1 TaxID=3111011 RepID=UPI002DBA3756|nr:aerolysin family beta-barrel pore-forming toxin [Grimontia sp. NTOU-MAR1]WRV99673.1 aerolysin family beta-barrel pore-forming toxin [Grimontia sp. NTOU-MAR1]